MLCYSVIYYQNDAEERLNLGLIVYDDNHHKLRFTKNWNRVLNFVDDGPTHRLLMSRISLMEVWHYEKYMQEIAFANVRGEHQKVFFTSPKTTLFTDKDTLLAELAPQFLVERERLF
jgi:hypothetical protein